MRRVLPFIALGLILVGGVPALVAAPRWSWSTSLDTIVGIGDTRYLMEEPYAFPTYGVSSELIFPLDTLLEGVTFRGDKIGGRRDGGRNWGLEVSLAVNLLAPFGLMTDSDWWMYPDVPKLLWSYTESNVTMTWLVLSAAWRMSMASGQWGSLDGVLGYRLQYVDQQAKGYNGWQNDTYPYDGKPDGYYPKSYTGLALTYWVLWNVPTAGLAVTLNPGPAVAVALEAGLAVPYVADQDDHVLRHFLATASGLGLGGYAELSARYSWGKAESRVHPYLSLTGSVLYMKANTLQTWTWYGDDPTTTLVEQPGDYISGVDHQISTRQFSAALAFGITY